MNLPQKVVMDKVLVFIEPGLCPCALRIVAGWRGHNSARANRGLLYAPQL